MSAGCRVLLGLTLALAMLLSGGCGYRMAGSGALFREDVSTVAVPVVSNQTFYRSDTTQLTDALVRTLETRTPYRVAPPETADTLLEVKISDVRRLTTSRNRQTALPEEQLYAVVVDVAWKDLRTGEILMRRENLEQTAVQYPTLGESRYVASQDAAEELAAGIIEEMGGNW